MLSVISATSKQEVNGPTMSIEHEDCILCDICGTYFGTKRFLDIHNGKEHKHILTVEDSSDDKKKV